MLAGSLVLNAPLEGYLAPDHPVQARIRAVVEELSGCPPSSIRYGVDGCSVPNPGLPLRAIARSLAALAATEDPRARTIVEAMTAHPHLVGGTGRFDTRLMEVAGGRLLAKGGAAGLHCTVELRTGRALTVKLESGDGTWIHAAVVAALERFMRDMASESWTDDVVIRIGVFDARVLLIDGIHRGIAYLGCVADGVSPDRLPALHVHL